MLSTRTKLQEKLRREIKTVRDSNIEGIAALPNLDCVVRETLRLYVVLLACFVISDTDAGFQRFPPLITIARK